MVIKRFAFTMIELIMVIVVLGIIAAIAMPRLERDVRQEVADQILTDIRFTQHMALMDNVINPENSNWQSALWTIGFQECATNDNVFYYIGSDKDYGGSLGSDEMAIDASNGKKMITRAYNPCLGPENLASNVSKRTFISKKGISTVDFTNCTPVTGASGTNNNRYIGFDHLGRPHKGHLGSTSPDFSTIMQGECKIAFKFVTGSGIDDIEIIIEPETGHAHIVGYDKS